MIKYRLRHKEIHEPDQHEFLQRNIDNLNLKLSETERSLREAKSNASISTLEGSVNANSAALADLEKEWREAQSDLASEQSIIKDRQAMLASSTSASATNAPSAAKSSPPVPDEVVTEYRRNNNLLAGLRKKEVELLDQNFSETATTVVTIHKSIQEKEALIKKQEDQYPALLAVKTIIAPLLLRRIGQ